MKPVKIEQSISITKKKRIGMTKKANLIFPCARIGRYIRNLNVAKRIGEGAPVYLAAILEYLVAEVLELAGNVAKRYNRKRITPRHIQLAVHSDDELRVVLKNVTLAEGGVIPSCHPALFPDSSKKKNT